MGILSAFWQYLTCRHDWQWTDEHGRDLPALTCRKCGARYTWQAN